MIAELTNTYLVKIMDDKIVEEKFLQINGHKIRYLESGDSEKTLVLVHGLGASAERWNPVIPLFQDDFRVIVPDLVGFGYSDKPHIDYTLEFFLEFFKNFLATCGITRPYLIGSSLGGQIAADFAASCPQDIEKLALVSPSGSMKQSTPALDAYIMAALYPNEQNAKNAFEMMETSKRDIPKEIINGFIKRMRLPNAKLAFMSTLLGLQNSKLVSTKLERISTPTILIWGSDDPVIPIIHSESFVSAIQNCKFLKMDGCGHTPYVQEPHLFASKVLEFFNST